MQLIKRVNQKINSSSADKDKPFSYHDKRIFYASLLILINCLNSDLIIENTHEDIVITCVFYMKLLIVIIH